MAGFAAMVAAAAAPLPPIPSLGTRSIVVMKETTTTEQFESHISGLVGTIRDTIHHQFNFGPSFKGYNGVFDHASIQLLQAMPLVSTFIFVAVSRFFQD